MNDQTPEGDAASREPMDPESVVDNWVHAFCEEENDAPVEIPEDPVLRLRAADHCWIDALLERALRRDVGDTSRRVQRALSAIDTEAPEPLVGGPSPHSREKLVPRKWLSLSWMAAAAIIVGALMWAWKNGPHQVAYADVRESLQEAEQPKDRQYKISTHLQSDTGKAFEVSGVLYVRGGEKFALKHIDFSKNQRWFGSNGQEGWYTSDTEENRKCNGVARLLDWARDEGVGLPDLQLTALLSRFAHEYKLARLPSELLDGDPGIYWKRVRGVRIAKTGMTPDALELWVHPETGVARRFELVWDHPLGKDGLTSITLDLVDEKPMPDDWYEAFTHSPQPPELPSL